MDLKVPQATVAFRVLIGVVVVFVFVSAYGYYEGEDAFGALFILLAMYYGFCALMLAGAVATNGAQRRIE